MLFWSEPLELAQGYIVDSTVGHIAASVKTQILSQLTCSCSLYLHNTLVITISR